MKIVILFCLLPVVSWAQGLQFPRESIHFTLDTTHFEVNGYYYFVNTAKTQTSFAISYPFPVQSSKIDSAWLINCKTMQPIRYSMQEKSLQFMINLASNDTLVLNIGYRQVHDGHQAIYILTTTQFWGAALENALYTLQVKPSVEIKNISLKTNEIKQINNEQYYFFRLNQFMPTKDFVVDFVKKRI